jgi:hypothetical protein
LGRYGYRLGVSASSESNRASLVSKDTEFKFPRAIDTDSPSDCEKFLEGYFASHKVDSDPTLLLLADGEIEKAVEVAESFVAKFLPLRKTAQRISNRSTDRKYSVPTKREMEIYKKLRKARVENSAFSCDVNIWKMS